MTSIKSHPIAVKAALVCGGILVVLFLMKKSKKFPNVFNVSLGKGGGDIVMGDIKLPDTPNYYGNDSAGGNGAYNNTPAGNEYMTMFGMVGNGPMESPAAKVDAKSNPVPSAILSATSGHYSGVGNAASYMDRFTATSSETIH